MLLSRRRQRTNRNLKSLNEVHIDGQAIRHNFQLLQSLQPTHHIFPVLKSNAYGHGTQHIATVLKDLDTPLICVDSYPEAQIVRKFSKKEVLMMGETFPENYRHYNHTRLHVAVWSEAVIDALMQTEKSRKVHLFLNTGMNREGIQPSDLHSLLSKISNSNLQVVGVMSHFANADEDDASFDDHQIAIFKQGVEKIMEAGHAPTYIHHHNSAGLVRHDDTVFTASRAGLAIMGWSPLTDRNLLGRKYTTLRPALSVRSTVTAIQSLQAGESVSYGLHRTASNDTRIAVIPFGYTEGLRRSLKGKWQVRWNDQYFPVVGTICMNLCCIDIGDAEVCLGDRVEVISNQKNGQNSIDQFATLDETIVYEVLVNIGSLVKRVVV